MNKIKEWWGKRKKWERFIILIVIIGLVFYFLYRFEMVIATLFLILSIILLVYYFLKKKLEKRTKKFVLIGLLVGFLVPLLNAFIFKIKILFAIFDISDLLSKIIKCSGGCWEILIYSFYSLFIIYAIIGGLIGFIISKIKK